MHKMIKSIKSYFKKLSKKSSKKTKMEKKNWSPETIVKVVTCSYYNPELDCTVNTNFSHYGFEFGGEMDTCRDLTFSTMLDHLECL